MTVNLGELANWTDEEIRQKAELDPEWFASVLAEFAVGVEEDRKSNQLQYYTLANPMALPVHLSRAREVAIVGGNRSSKTDTMLAELSIQMTGVIPMSLQGKYPKDKLRAPIRSRIVCNSLTDTLEPVIKPKLRFDQWNGIGDAIDGKGHWWWIPQHLLKSGTWEGAYSEKYRTLYTAVDSTWVSGGSVRTSRAYSSCQFLSYDQDLSAFAGSSMHFVGHDELPPADIYRENRMRTLDVKGQIYTAFTPPDEAGASRGDVTWFFDTVYEPGLVKSDAVESIILHTERNQILDAQTIQDLSARLTPEQREVRLLGRFIHLSGVIYSSFSRHESWWCYKCCKKILPIKRECPTCHTDDVDVFSHVIEPFVPPSHWPVVFVIDPHPRKNDVMGWFAITPSDDVLMIGELEVGGTAMEIAEAVRRYENANKLSPVLRLMDPNIATETNDKMQRGWTIQEAYDEVGLRCDLAIDAMNTGIRFVQEALLPDQRTRRPRFATFATCERFIYGMTRWSWDDYSRQGDRELKERPRDRYKDFPDLVRYLFNMQPSYNSLRHGGGLIRLRDRRP